MSLIRSVLCLAATILAAPALAGTVDARLETVLASTPADGRVAVIVEMQERSDPAAAARNAPRNDRVARGRAVVGELKRHADRSQAPIRAQLGHEQAQGRVARVRPFWVFNGLAVTATPAAIRSLARRPDVREVRLDVAIAPPRIRRSSTAAPATTAPPVWNLEMVRAPETWSLGHTGSGVVVGSFDTGVDGTHPDLAPRYRGNHATSWFDPYGEHATPYDGNGHGTHTTGTMVGGEYSGQAIGVAPGARWIGAKGWSDAGEATASAFHEIFEWFLAPGGDPANAPDIVNGSWGMTPVECDPEFRADILAFRAAGILPVFASGNSGPLPGSALAPAMYPESFAVGATDFFDDITTFSGQGPSGCDGAVKPDVSAPGVAILSSLPGGFHWELDGTSMAAPHVSGAAAILRSIDPTITVEQLEATLAEGAIDLGPPGPDNAYGAGRLDVLQSASIVLGISLAGIQATAPNASETGQVGRFTITRRGSTTDALTLAYAVTGTATAGEDYVALPGSITLPAGISSATITVTPIDDARVELTETVVVTLAPGGDYLLAPAQATVSIASDEIPPDLVVTAVNGSATGGAGLPVTVGDTVRNQGSVAAEASSTVFFLSGNALLDGGDVRLGERAVPALAPGASSAGSVTLTLPGGLAAGAWYLIAKADGDDGLVETLETNNTASRTLVVGPDLQVSAATVPASGGAGHALVVTETTRNAGAGAAAASSTSFFLSTDNTFDASDVALGTRAVAALAPGASSTAATTLTLPATLATGTYYVFIRADAAGAVAEAYENNNLTSRVIRVGPDLWMLSITSPAAAGAGSTLAVGDSVRNSGGGTAGPGVTRFFLSADTLLGASDVFLGERATAAIAPGGTDSGSASLTIPAGTVAGAYFLVAKADGGATVAETVEDNNTSARPLAIGPDLVVTAITAPVTGGAGMAVALGDTTRNQAAGGTAASSTAFYLSPDAAWDAGDVLLGSRAVGPLAPGASDAGTVTVYLPAGTATGWHYIVARADGAGTVAETNEANNALSRSIRVGPDLVVASFTVPASAAAGVPVGVSDTTTNGGGGGAGATATRYYFSTNTILDAGDVLVGERAVGALAAGGSLSGPATVTLPPDAPSGYMYLIARADDAGTLAETQENNNTLARGIVVGPDLQVAAATVPSASGAGLAITVGDSTRNAGVAAVPATVTATYLSTNPAWDAADMLLGTRNVPALAAGAVDSGSTTVELPASLAAGTYYVVVRVDDTSVVAEAYENNNATSRVLRVGPDLAIQGLVAPTSAGAGATIDVTDIVRNYGGGAAEASLTRFYLSLDTVLGPSDVALGERAAGAVAAGASDSGTVALVIPAGTAPRAYYLIAQTDAAQAVAETIESNNVAFRYVTVTAP